MINATAGALMVYAFIHRNKEFRNVAILLTVVGLSKVAFYDLLVAHGVPLVVSVFTFGLTTTLESLVLSRWHNLDTDKG